MTDPSRAQPAQLGRKADPRQRFTGRADRYVRWRPSYPPGLIELLRDECGLGAESVVVDLGSGTGKLAELFLDAGCTVYGVEPNAEMRAAGEACLAACERFASVDGSAEATGLPDGVADFVTAGQAFHWFDPEATRAEVDRVLKPGGWIVLVWNQRLKDENAFLREYERLLIEHGTDYPLVTHRNSPVETFLGEHRYGELAYVQELDYEGLEGRLLSTSYVPTAGEPGHDAMLEALHALFERHAVDGLVEIPYRTRIYYARMY